MLNVHFHTLVLDGVYARDPGRGLRFRPLPPPTDAEIERIARKLVRRLERLLERRDLDFVLRLGDRIDAEDLKERHTPLCAQVGGVSLHAGVAVPAHDRRRLERLCRYVARPPIATERLSGLPDGRLLYALKRRWRDGTTHMLFEPLELIERIVALIPPPRAHLVRYHGVLAPAARARAQVTHDRRPERPRPGEPTTLDASPSGEPLRESSADERPGSAAQVTLRAAGLTEDRAGSLPLGRSDEASDPRHDHSELLQRERRLPWAELMRRVFLIDVLECPGCKGRMRVIAAIDQPHLIARILAHLGFPARAPPLAPPQFEPAEQPEALVDPDQPTRTRRSSVPV